MKALAKERSRRYDSAIGLANDVERFLNHEPVTAGPPTAGYRLRKFARRNRAQVVAALLVLVALIGGIVGTSLGLFEARRHEREARRHEREARRHEAIAVAETRKKELALQAEALQRQKTDEQRRQAEKRLAQVEKANGILNSIFKDLNPRSAEKDGKPLSALLGERLDQATAQIEGEAIGDPLAVARMQLALGDSQLGLGYPEKAIALCTKARSALTVHLGPDHPDTLASMNKLAEAYSAAGELDRALPLLEETLALRKAKLGPGHPDTLTSMNNLALGYRDAGKLDRALPLFEETLALKKAKLGPGHPDTLNCMINLAVAYREARDFDRALPLGEQTLSLIKSKLGPDHPYTLISMGNLAQGYRDAGKFDRAVPLLREIADLWKRRAGSDSPPYAGALASLGSNLLLQKTWDDAETVLCESLTIREAKEPDAWTTFNTKSMLGRALLGQKKYIEAEPLLRAGYEGMKARADTIPPPSKIRPGQALDRLIELAEATGKSDDVKMWKDEKAKWPDTPAPKLDAGKK